MPCMQKTVLSGTVFFIGFKEYQSLMFGRLICRAVELFDVFKDSRAYALEFRSAEKTLTDDEVGRAFQRIVEALKATDGLEVREG